jgi:GcrA cell cycle regulator
MSGPVEADRRRRWTADMEAALREHFARRLTCAESAGLLGVSRNAVIGKRTRLGLVTPPAPMAHEKPASAPRHPGGDGTAMRFMLFRIARGRVLPRFPLPAMAPGAQDFVDAKVLAELGRHQCRWPLQDAGEEADGSTLFCADPCQGSRVYCERHHRLAHGQHQQDDKAAEKQAA